MWSIGLYVVYWRFGENCYGYLHFNEKDMIFFFKCKKRGGKTEVCLLIVLYHTVRFRLISTNQGINKPNKLFASHQLLWDED